MVRAVLPALVALTVLSACLSEANKPVPPGGDPNWSGTADLLTQPPADGLYN